MVFCLQDNSQQICWGQVAPTSFASYHPFLFLSFSLFGFSGSLLCHGGFSPVVGCSCGMWGLSTQAQQLWHMGLVAHIACGILVPRPGFEPASPALEGRFLTTGPPGKSPISPVLTQLAFLQISLWRKGHLVRSLPLYFGKLNQRMPSCGFVQNSLFNLLSGLE